MDDDQDDFQALFIGGGGGDQWGFCIHSTHHQPTRPFFFFFPNFTSLSLVGEMLVAASLVRIENKQTTLQVDSLRLQTRWLLYNHLTAKIK